MIKADVFLMSLNDETISLVDIKVSEDDFVGEKYLEYTLLSKYTEDFSISVVVQISDIWITCFVDISISFIEVRVSEVVL